MRSKGVFWAISFLMGVCVSAQNLQWEGKAEALAVFSSEEQIPFWFHTNTETQLGTQSQFSGLGEIKGTYSLSENASLQFGGSFFYRNEVPDEFQRKELYAQFKNTWLKATLGAKSITQEAKGLSATNKNFLFSGNARPIPGMTLEANEPLTLSKTFALDWGIGHYVLNDDRFVDNTRLHYKRLGLLIHFNENNLLTLRLQHYVQWAGTSPVYGKLKSDFEAFIDVFTARKSSEIGTDGEIYNAVGNHLGTYLFDYQFKNPWGAFSLYHEHPFEDGSGTRFANFPDGIWGVYFQPKESNFLNGFLYEFITTKDQSVGSVGYDNYFSNNVYRSGWSYERHIIGLPFMLIDPAVEITPLNSPILSNRVVAHHFGLSGTFKKVAWTLKSSIVQNLSSYLQSETTNLHFWYNYLDLQYTTQDVGTFRAFGGLDTGNSLDTTAGLGLGYRYSF